MPVSIEYAPVTSTQETVQEQVLANKVSFSGFALPSILMSQEFEVTPSYDPITQQGNAYLIYCSEDDAKVRIHHIKDVPPVDTADQKQEVFDRCGKETLVQTLPDESGQDTAIITLHAKSGGQLLMRVMQSEFNPSIN